MVLTQVLFYIFAVIMLLSAITVITTKNQVTAVLFLVLAFITASVLWIMLDVEFLALILIIIYVGAVMVLFLFIVMMLDIDIEVMRKGFWKNLPLALLVGIIIIVELVAILASKPILIVPSNENISSINVLAMALYKNYSYPVELASVILLLALVIATVLSLHHNTKEAKTQNIKKQVNANPKERLSIIKLDPEELLTGKSDANNVLNKKND